MCWGLGEDPVGKVLATQAWDPECKSIFSMDKSGMVLICEPSPGLELPVDRWMTGAFWTDTSTHMHTQTTYLPPLPHTHLEKCQICVSGSCMYFFLSEHTPLQNRSVSHSNQTFCLNKAKERKKNQQVSNLKIKLHWLIYEN